MVSLTTQSNYYMMMMKKMTLMASLTTLQLGKAVTAFTKEYNIAWKDP